MRVGSLVACTNGAFTLLSSKPITLPIEGEIYTVRHIDAVRQNILLDEVVNETGPCLHMVYGDRTFREPAFATSRFLEIQPPMSLEFIEEMQHPLTLLQSK